MNQQNVFITPYKKVLDVAISKGLMMILNIFGFSAYFSGLYFAWINVDVFTRTVMQLLGCVFLLIKMVIMVDRWFHNRYMEKKERRKADVEQMEREDKFLRGH